MARVHERLIRFAGPLTLHQGNHEFLPGLPLGRSRVERGPGWQFVPRGSGLGTYTEIRAKARSESRVSVCQAGLFGLEVGI